MELTCKGSAKEIFEKVRARLDHLRDQGKIPNLKDLAYDDTRCEVMASGAGFKARIQCHDDVVKVNLDLGLLLKPMRGQIEDMIMKTLSKAVHS